MELLYLDPNSKSNIDLEPGNLLDRVSYLHLCLCTIWCVRVNLIIATNANDTDKGAGSLEKTYLYMNRTSQVAIATSTS